MSKNNPNERRLLERITIRTLHIFPLIYIITVTVGLLYAFVSDRRLIGWDLYSHYYLVEKMVQNLKSGSIFSYDSSWFAGYPAFTFYGPFPYILAALIHFLSYKLFSVTLSFNILNFFLPFGFLFSVYILVRDRLNKNAATFALIYSFFYLVFPGYLDITDVGIYGSILHGHTAAFLACILNILLLWRLDRLQVDVTEDINSPRNKSKAVDILCCSLIFTLIILSHALTTIFSLLMVIFHGCFYGKRHFFRVLLVLFISLIASAFYLVPFIENLWLSSSTHLPVEIDPLISLFPDLAAVGECLKHISSLDYFGAIPFGAIYSTILVLLAVIFGISVCFRRKDYFLPVFLFFILLVLSRNVLSRIFSLELHYYRFILPTIPIVVIVAAYGVDFVINLITKSRIYLTKAVGFSVLILLHFWALFANGLHFYQYYPWSLLQKTAVFQASRFACDRRKVVDPIKYEDQVKAITGARELLDELNKVAPPGPVAVQTSYSLLQDIPSPHLLNTYFALNSTISTNTGLLAESSLSTGFLVPIWGYLTQSMSWGRNKLGHYFERRPPLLSLLKRLAYYGIEYLVVGYKYFATDYMVYNGEQPLQNSIKELEYISNTSTGISFEGTFPPFYLYRLSYAKPLIESTSYKPFLFIERGGMKFREFSELWFQDDILLENPVIFTKRSFAELKQRERDQIAGFIISYPDEKLITQDDISTFLNSNKTILILNGKLDSKLISRVDLERIGTHDHELFVLQLRRFLVDSSELISTPIKPELLNDSAIKFNSEGGVIIRRTYFPWWRDKISDRTVFLMTPSFMYVVSEGESNLIYEKPGIQRLWRNWD